ncbi:MAG: hypothetical protein COX90_03160 [Candidatus Nealsonbacteria bacterium CG_4_10_14_0_2_um_filter_38_17]|uniref:Prepilin-type N-terminal cleavage/methylation domain-containing protein n=2 Tax=Candidatus Nealsoniibacteriota TaxID=1817911 RepID=A0A2M7UXM7_9BACT|nr:MAG: hypothetical protein COX36_00855 [Candidatus Nealsonbacteria bacterium CG23_combo_of_CG06-09_8_20_14_all_38_19]PIZ88712.1 MAG: hypothetical protein COX90_03160 [Candidatus Nealsonbacteria bacterium CG_4_10_14_0_2_um_filter_38_17]
MVKRGFTLIEFLIYSAILGMVLVLAVGFLWNMVFGSIKEASYEEVQENSRFALMKITQEIKRAKAISNPAPGFSSNTLSLSMNNPSFNPTVFDIVDGKLRITIGSSGPYELTSSQVIVNSVQFTNLSYPDTSGIIRIEMTISHINPGNQSEYQASINLNSSVSLSPGGAVQ